MHRNLMSGWVRWCSGGRPGRRFTAASLIAVIAAAGLPARAQTVTLTPADTTEFAVTYPGNLTVDAAAVTAFGAALPVGILVTNTTAGAATLNGTLTSNGGGSFASSPNAYTFQGSGLQPSGNSTGSYVNGPTVTVTNVSGGITVELPGSSSTFPGIISAVSVGALGFNPAVGRPANDIFNGGNGGAVTLNFNGGVLNASIISNAAGSAVPWQPYVTGGYAASTGGAGVDTAFDGGQLGNGGAGGAVTVSTLSSAAIVINSSSSGGALIEGITALSQGGANGTYDTGGALAYGLPGVGGPVTVTHAGSIYGTAQYSIGISATSIGGSPPEATEFLLAYPPLPGPGGTVNVTLYSGGRINLQNGSAIGVLAASTFGAYFLPVTLGYPSGDVTVTLQPGSSVSTGPAPGQPTGTFNVGVLAISAGSAALLEPFAANTVALGGGGAGGAVSVANGGSISTYGEMAIGVAALSVGGSGVVTNAAPAGINTLGNATGGSGSAQGGTVSVTNTGSISTNGASAFGIVALSGGAGGLIDADTSAVFNTISKTVTSGVILGTTADIGSASPGSSVSVTNSGTIRTGDGTGGGRVAIGIVAQSIGGGGGSAGGLGAAAFVGDQTGSGGAGGAVSVTTQGGGITTYDDGALGILAQSIGGGGGNGANASGVFAAVGGQGGSGGAGGQVSVTLGQGGTAGTMSTSGDFAANVIAQSIGGGGGNGGYAKSHGVFVSTAIGGTGGSGGAGGSVSFLNSDATLTTTGEQSHGVLAQSVGGGGGNGGAANAYSVGVIFSAAVAVGGTGGSGGAGGTVTATNQGVMTTSGTDSIGIVAQSVGGGGGNAGSALTKSLAFAGDPEIPTISFSTAIGGTGGSGNGGGSVTVTNQQGNISTQGNGGTAILAQSIGGGGGNGGDSTAAANAWLGEAPTIKIGVSIGGFGGGGGNGGAVSVTNQPSIPATGGPCPGCTGSGSGQISTTGDNATAIIAQSIGGGGGNGGGGNASVTSQNVGGTPGIALSTSIAVGGSGGSGGGGNTTTVTNAAGASITTTGSGSQGILAQSIGGGGGSGGGGASAGSGDNVNINVSVGGSGGGGGTGNTVTVTNNGTISTGQVVVGASIPVVRGGDAVGILAQSIGGGGGVGGSTDAAATFPPLAQIENLINTPAAGYTANVSVGGTGGGGNAGGTVKVTNGGSITTLGERAYGIMAQSIGGGGGSGGAATSAAGSALGVRDPTTDSGYTYSSTISVAGNGGTSGSSGSATVTNNGVIGTAGYGATAIVAQGIGGGGGVGGDGTVNNHATIGLGFNDNGAGGSEGTGGIVSVTNNDVVATVGDDAHGILAQSIGGGGGLGSGGCSNSASSGALGLTASSCFGNTNVGAAGSAGRWNDSSSFTLTAGGGAGASGWGNTVTVTENGTIMTTGARALGIAAQSIGGGGGLATAAAVNIASTPLAQAAGQNYAKGGDVSVTVGPGASITTLGAGSWGILAQSIGGGGGLIGDPSLPLALPVSNTLPDHANSNGNYPDSGTVTINVAGNITTSGAYAHGIVAQAVGGGGGIAAGYGNSTNATVVMGNSGQIYGLTGATYAGEGKSVSITQTAGTIQTSGTGSIAIIAQSSGKTDYTQQITISLSGTVIGGTNQGANLGGTNVGAAGILVSGGVLPGSNTGGPSANTITINAGGSVSTMDGVAGTAIIATSGKTDVTNNGTLTGSVNLGATPGSLTNNGTFNSGSTVVVSADTFTNTGTLNVGGFNAIGTTSVSGGFHQTAGGRLAVDIDVTAPQKSDQIVVAGHALVEGTIVPNARTLLPGAFPIVTADSLTLTGAARQALVFRWGAGTDGRTLSLTPSANFTPDGVQLSPTRASLAGYLTNAWNNSDRSLSDLFGYHAQIATAKQYIATGNALSARATQGLAAELENGGSALLGTALSCPVFVDQGTLLGEDSCTWAKLTGGWTNSGSSSGDPGYNVDATTYRIGAQKSVAPGWYVGGTLGAGSTWGQSGGSSSHGTVFDGTLAVKHTMGPWLFAGSIAIANEAYHTNRIVDLPPIGTTAGYQGVYESDPSIFLAGARARVAYEFSFAHTYVRPYGDLDVIYTHTPSFREYGPDNLALAVGSSDKASVVISPMVELGGRYDIDAATVLRPYLAAGVSFRPSNTRTVNASFVGALSADGSFQTIVTSPDVVGVLDLGVQLYRAGRWEAKAEYGLRAGGSYVAQNAGVRVAYHF